MSLREGEKGNVLLRARKYLWQRSRLRKYPGISMFALLLQTFYLA